MAPQDERKLEVGEVVETDQGTFVVTAVSYQDDAEGNHVNFTYQIKDPADVVVAEEETTDESNN